MSDTEYRPVKFGKDNCFEFEYYDYRYSMFEYILVEDLEFPIKIKQFPLLGIPGYLWDASFVLTKFLETQDLQGKTLLELGSGLGLPSIFSSIKGAQVTSTDLSEVLPNTNFNIDLNRSSLTGSISCQVLDWTNPSHYTGLSQIPWDYIIMSDVFYLPVSSK